MNRKWIGIALAAILLAALFLFNRKEVQLLPQNELVLTAISNTGYSLKSKMVFYNPNLLSSTVLSISEEIFVNNKRVGIIENNIEQGIPGRKESVFPVEVRFDKSDIDTTMLQTDSLVIATKGIVLYKNMSGSDTIFISQQKIISNSVK
jgi:LEA14-like dessication related protein